MDCSAGKISTITQRSAYTNDLSTPPIGCVLCLPGLPGGGNKICDRSPYGNTGTIIGATWVRTAGGLWCLDFDGVDDRVDCGCSSEFDITSTLTIAAWVYIAAAAGASKWPGFVDKNDAYSLRLDQNSTDIYGRFKVGGASKFSNHYVASLNTWYFVVLTYSYPGYIRLYIQGVEAVSPVATVGSLDTNANHVYVGSTATSFSLNGRIALPRVINTTWSALEIQNHFTQEKHLFGVW